MIYTTGTIAINGNTVTGTGTNFSEPLSLIRVGCTLIAVGNPVQIFTITEIKSGTELSVTPAANPAIAAGTKFSILLSDSISVDGLAQDVAETLRYYQGKETEIASAVEWWNEFGGDGHIEQLLADIRTETERSATNAQKTEADKNAVAMLKTDIESSASTATTKASEASASAAYADTKSGDAEASATSAAASAAEAKTSETNAATSASTAAAQAAAATAVATGNLETALPASAYIKDANRYAVERASGGRQTVLYDDLGNPSVMNIIPIFRYEDLGYSEDMGTGVVSCFDVGTGANKSEIFIGSFQSSLVGSRAVSLPRVDPAAYVKFDEAKGYCANKGAGWHLMTMHEWAAISLWCMANDFEPRGNTNYGRAHDRYVERGRRTDGRMAGDTAGTARVHAGSGPDAWRHNNSPWGISDLVGNVWEWLDGFKLQDGQIIASTFNTQAEASWAAQAAYFDSTMAKGGAPRLSDAVVNRLGTIGDNTDIGYTADEKFDVMTKTGTYVSNQLLKRLLVEPSTVLPKGHVYMRNFGERLPCRGGAWGLGGVAGLAALNCYYSRVFADGFLGFRLAFA
ncbi:TPA: SUMF1/EgtB/PvdO family nonheme iron enzyme [Escherichia coli]